jgi:hypothetical protein
MLAPHCSLVRIPWIGRIAVVSVFTAFYFAQIAAGQSAPASLAAQNGQPAQAKPATSGQETTPVPPSGSAPARAAYQPTCPPNAAASIPMSATIVAKVTGPMDSGHLKVGKEFWVTVQEAIAYPGCKLSAGSAIYGHVTSALSQKSSPTSELSLAFDHADCEDHGKKEMKLWLIGLIGPAEVDARLHDDLPMGELTKKRSANTATKISTFTDFKLNPGGAPNTVHPGIVLGMPKLKLDVQGGPACSSARISSTDHTAVLELGSNLILIPQSAP